MTFISFDFFVFLILIVGLYYLFPIKARWVVLLCGSLGFYATLCSFSVWRISVLIITALVCWGLGLLQKDHKNKLICAVSVVVSMLPLLVIENAPFVFKSMGITKPGWWIMPLGISFYTLVLVAYSVDLYRGVTEVETNFLHFLLFVSFFPQIIQGPIVRHKDYALQLKTGHRFDERQFVKGAMLFLWGVILKLCIADKANIVVDQIYENYPTYKGAYILTATFMFSFQLYTDFLGYTCMARGIAALFGIELMDNFERPFLSTSTKELWRRWHISLSSWLRDYVYFPLGGSRKGKIRKYINLIIVFIVSGFWHGVTFNFIIWGLLQAVFQIIGEWMAPVINKIQATVIGAKYKLLGKAIRIFVTFNLFMFSLIFFRVAKLRDALSMIKSVFVVRNGWIFASEEIFKLGLVWKEWMLLWGCIALLFVVELYQEMGTKIRDKILELNIIARWIIYIAAIVFVIVFGTYGYGYDAQSFLYGGF